MAFPSAVTVPTDTWAVWGADPGSPRSGYLRYFSILGPTRVGRVDVLGGDDEGPVGVTEARLDVCGVQCPWPEGAPRTAAKARTERPDRGGAARSADDEELATPETQPRFAQSHPVIALLIALASSFGASRATRCPASMSTTSSSGTAEPRRWTSLSPIAESLPRTSITGTRAEAMRLFR